MSSGKITTYHRMPEAFGATAFQFIGLAIAAFLLGITWPFDFH